mgnify:CR=1 FL=1
MNTQTKRNTLRLATMGMLAALAVLLVAFVHFPLIPAAPFLEYDPADVPILIGTFLYGPWAGLGLAGVVCIVQGLTVSAASGPIGILMHFLGTGACVLAAGLIYRRWHTFKGAGRVCAGAHGGDVRVQPGVHAAVSGLFRGGSGGNAAARHHPVQPAVCRAERRRHAACL